MYNTPGTATDSTTANTASNCLSPWMTSNRDSTKEANSSHASATNFIKSPCINPFILVL